MFKKHVFDYLDEKPWRFAVAVSALSACYLIAMSLVLFSVFRG
jgi:hypothetical protein